MLDARDLLERPEPMLRALCTALSVPFGPEMLCWAAGAAVLELAAADGLPCVVGDHSLTQFHAADEVFVTGTMGGLAAVTRLDGRVTGSGAPGPVTRRLTDLYTGLTATSGTPVA